MALLDETDIEILHSLQKDAKINAKELSEKLHISKTPIYALYCFLCSEYEND